MLAMLERPSSPKIRVPTLLKGVVEVSEDNLITFISPLFGFEELKRFLVYQTQPGAMYWLQSVDQEKASFCLLAPFAAGIDPDMAISPDDVKDIGASGANDIDVYTVVVLDADPAQVRTNLRAPILVSRTTNRAKQIVLNDPALPIKYYLRELTARKIV
jgi:flagellar assembly factor FliW